MAELEAFHSFADFGQLLVAPVGQVHDLDQRIEFDVGGPGAGTSPDLFDLGVQPHRVPPDRVGVAVGQRATQTLQANDVAAYSWGVWSAPRSSSTRPPDRRSRLAISHANWTGLRMSWFSTSVPSRMVVVACAITLKAVNGAGPWVPTWSGSTTTSNPSSSARRAVDAGSSRSWSLGWNANRNGRCTDGDLPHDDGTSIK